MCVLIYGTTFRVSSPAHWPFYPRTVFWMHTDQVHGAHCRFFSIWAFGGDFHMLWIEIYCCVVNYRCCVPFNSYLFFRLTKYNKERKFPIEFRFLEGFEKCIVKPSIVPNLHCRTFRFHSVLLSPDACMYKIKALALSWANRYQAALEW